MALGICGIHAVLGIHVLLGVFLYMAYTVQMVYVHILYGYVCIYFVYVA